MSKHRVAASSLQNETSSILNPSSDFILANYTVFTDSTIIIPVLVYQVFFPNEHRPLINKSNNCLLRCILFNPIPNNLSVNVKGATMPSRRLCGRVVCRAEDALQEQLVAWSNNTAGCLLAACMPV